jgi:hypothetical protein
MDLAFVTLTAFLALLTFGLVRLCTSLLGGRR